MGEATFQIKLSQPGAKLPPNYGPFNNYPPTQRLLNKTKKMFGLMKPQKQDNDIWGKSENLETVVQNSQKGDINGLSANVQCSTLLSYISLLSGLWNITKEVSKPAWLRNKMKKGLRGKSKWQLTYKVQWAIRSCCWTFKTWIGQLCFNGFAPLWVQINLWWGTFVELLASPINYDLQPSWRCSRAIYIELSHCLSYLW